ncbi:MAG: ribosome assembly cofactor RimP [Flavobacteriaceae bacterium]
MLRERIEAVLAKVLEERKSLFLIDYSVGNDNTIKIVLDGDQGVNLKDCIDVSRAVESKLDREQNDFALEVTSAGATSPLLVPRQYRKNVGRKLSVRTPENQYEGNLTAADSDTITLEWKTREPKPVGKGKVTIQKKKDIPISEIEEAKVVLKF